jgi:hypothetical protein
VILSVCLVGKVSQTWSWGLPWMHVLVFTLRVGPRTEFGKPCATGVSHVCLNEKISDLTVHNHVSLSSPVYLSGLRWQPTFTPSTRPQPTYSSASHQVSHYPFKMAAKRAVCEIVHSFPVHLYWTMNIDHHWHGRVGFIVENLWTCYFETFTPMLNFIIKASVWLDQIKKIS